MSATCPAGHTSTAEDYCDVCGIPIQADTGTSVAAPPPSPDVPADAAGSTGSATAAGHPCPNCGVQNADEALFCENCGYDFTTGSMPRPAEAEPTPEAGQPPVAEAPAAESPAEAPAEGVPATESPAPQVEAAPEFDWVAEMWIDPAWYEAQDSPDALPSPGLPEVLPLRGSSLLVGRRSVSRNIAPELDCGTDSGVSRRQAQLTTDGRRWFVEDLDSANGTFVGSASGALPTDPIPVGTKVELDADDRIYVGAWTRMVIRQATEDERSSLG